MPGPIPGWDEWNWRDMVEHRDSDVVSFDDKDGRPVSWEEVDGAYLGDDMIGVPEPCRECNRPDCLGCEHYIEGL